MLSIVEVQCPHCGVKGQMMLPPLGALIVGPCPNCHEFVMVFCGRVLPLQKQVLMEGTPEEKHAHMMSVLSEFLNERVQKVVEQIVPESAEGLQQFDDGLESPQQVESDQDGLQVTQMANRTISQEEFDSFVRMDLPQLDNSSYFKEIFR